MSGFKYIKRLDCNFTVYLLTRHLWWGQCEYACGSFLFLFQNMDSGPCRYLRRNTSSWTGFIVVLHMYLQISMSTAICQQVRGVHSSRSKGWLSSLIGCREVLLCLADSLHMPFFTYYDLLPACLTHKWRISFYLLWLAFKTGPLAGPILRTLVDLVVPSGFCLIKLLIYVQCTFSGVRSEIQILETPGTSSVPCSPLAISFN